MRVKETSIAFGLLTVLVVLSCCKRDTVPTRTGLELNKGKCAGCFLTAKDNLFSFVARTDADFESLKANCFHERIREEHHPPRPGADEILVYVSIRGSGCKGCLGIANVRETPQRIVVEAEGGFQGNCEKLIVPGAWALIRKTEKSIAFQFKNIDCPDDL